MAERCWVAADANSDSGDFRSSGCRGLQFAATAYSMSQSRVFLPLSVSSSPPLHLPLYPSLATPPPSSSWRRRQARADEWSREFAEWWREKPNGSRVDSWVKKKNTTNKMKRKSLRCITFRSHSANLSSLKSAGACSGHKRTCVK